MILVGDTQEHHIGGLPVAVIVNSVIDKQVEVTIRPPQQTLFGRKLMQSILDKNNGNPEDEIKPLPLVHLGDVTDVSCKEEWNRISPMLLRPNVAIAHGNHDGIAHGIFNNLSGGDGKQAFLFSATGWKLECVRPFSYTGLTPSYSVEPQIDDVLTSADFIRSYVTRKAATTSASVMDTEPFEFTTPDLVQKIVGRIEPEAGCLGKPECKKYTRSFVLQKITLPIPATSPDMSEKKVFMILMDTSQYDQEYILPNPTNPTTWTTLRYLIRNNPGEKGNLLPDQLAAIEKMVNDTSPDDVLIFGGHHDWKSLTERTQTALATIISKRTNQPLVYFSAHTHTGFMKKITLYGGRSLTEVNVNSLADWPVGMRLMSMQMSADRKVMKITSSIKLDSATDPVDDPDSTALAHQWENACVDGGNISKRAFDSHGGISNKHRRDGMALGNLVGFAKEWLSSKDSSNSQNLLYEDKFNDLKYAKAAIEQTSSDLPNFKKRLTEYLTTAPESICYGKSFDECLSTEIYLPEWKYPELNNRTKKPEVYYKKFTELYSAAQMVINETTEPKDVNYMKCAFVAAAIADHKAQYGITDSAQTNPPREFFQETIEAGM